MLAQRAIATQALCTPPAAVPLFVILSGDELVLACYSLAKTYGQHPDVFLNSSPVKVSEEVFWTARI